MNNPFETIDARLSNIETLLLDIKHAPKSFEDLPDRINLEEACKITGLRKPTIYKMSSLGEIPCFRVGERRLIFSRKELEKWLTDRTVRKQTPTEKVTPALQKSANKKLR